MERTLLDLGTQPLVNNLLPTAEAALAAPQFPLRAVYDDSLRIHLDYEVEPSVLYEHYLYRSGVNGPYFRHCSKMFQSFRHLQHDVVMDIGGNDGTLLKAFQEASDKPMRRINVDASASFHELNEAADIEYVHGMFNDAMDLPKANIITSTNVFQHTKDVDAFMRGICKFLDGIWILEFPYTYTTLLTGQFDQFYHEHYYYWLVTPLVKLFNDYGLTIIHVSDQSIHGGSLRMAMTNKQHCAPLDDDILAAYLQRESMLDLAGFNRTAQSVIRRSKDFLSTIEGDTVFFGAAAKGCVFLNALGLSIENMPNAYVVDDTVEKQGLFVPGTGFEVCSRQRLIDNPPANVVILAHNFAGHIAQSLRSSFDGRIYSCLPTVTSF
jgi:methylation protein EvaC